VARVEQSVSDGERVDDNFRMNSPLTLIF